LESTIIKKQKIEKKSNKKIYPKLRDQIHSPKLSFLNIPSKNNFWVFLQNNKVLTENIHMNDFALKEKRFKRNKYASESIFAGFLRNWD